MKRIAMLWLLFVCYIHVQAQTIIVKDSETENPLDLVSIITETPKQLLVVTNALGQADVTDFKESKQIEIRKLGYKTVRKSFSELASQNFVVPLTVSVTEFDEVVISGTRFAQRSKNVPSKISRITPKEVALTNPQTAAELLGSSGEVFIQKSQQGGGSPMIRGFSTNRLLYTVDGVRMNTAIFRAGNIQNVISLDPLSIENTEVFFGAGSVIYGSDAIGGVMSFQTLKPQYSLNDKVLIHGNAFSRTSSVNKELTNHFDVNLGWKKFAMLTSVTHTRYGDLRMGKYGPSEYLKKYYVVRMDSVDRVVENTDSLLQDPSGYSQFNIMQKLRYSPTKHWDLEYAFHYSETSEYSRYDRLIETNANGLPISAVWNYGPQIWMMNSLQLSNTSANKVYDRMTIRLAQQYFEESRIDRRLNHHRLRTNLEQVDASSANVDFEKRIGRSTFYYGLEYVQNKVTSTGTAVDIRDGSEILVPDRYPLSTWSTYAAYLNYQIKLTEKLMMQAGARFSAFKIESDFSRHLSFFPFDFTKANINNSSTTGSLGLIYSIDETWKIATNVSTGFRAPNVDDIGKIFDFASGEVVVPNANLDAEYAINIDGNISKVFGDYLKLDVSAFYTKLNNAMVRRAFKVNGQDSILYDGVMSKVYAIQNAAFANVYGFNVGIEIKLPAGFSLSSRYNYQYGEEEMDNGQISRSRHAAPAFGITRLNYQKDKLQLQWNATYCAEVSYANLNEEERQKPFIYAKDANGNPYSPNWYTLNFKASYQFIPNLSGSVGIENITDQRYRPYSSGIVAGGRNFVMALRANF